MLDNSLIFEGSAIPASALVLNAVAGATPVIECVYFLSSGATIIFIIPFHRL
jgi:hypothetical protein